MKSILISTICTLILSHAHANVKCEDTAIATAAKSQHMTEIQFKKEFFLKVRHSEVEEMVVAEAFLFQKKSNKNIEVSVNARAVKVMGKLKCSAKVSK